jgi:C1A family cysteine protease
MKHCTYRLNVRADRGDVNDLIYSPPQGVTLPDFASNAQWRAPIRDQGQEGSCGAFTARGAMEFIRNKMTVKYVELSPQFFYHNALIIENGSAANDTGLTMRTIPKALAKYGICHESLHPYTKAFKAKPTAKAFKDGLCFVPAEYRRITSIYNLQYAIAVDKLAVMIGVSVYQSMMSDEVARTGLVPVPVKGDKLAGGHALLCDEYDFRGGSPVFTGPNSWGADWGTAGAYHMPLPFVQSDDCLNDVWCITK